MARQHNSIPEDITEGISKIPWLAGVALALVCFLVLNWYAGRPLPAAGGSEPFSPGLLQSLAYYGQYVVPVLLLMISLASFVLNTKQKRLYGKTAGKESAGSLEGMSWRNFRFLVDEHFRRLHFTIEAPPKDLEADVDFVAVKGNEKYLVHCRKRQTEEVGESEVEGLGKVVATAGVTGGIVVTAGEHTKEAERLARAGRITLIGSRQLHADMGSQELSASIAERKTGGWMKKILWLSVALLVFLAAGTWLYSYKTGVPITTIWTTQIKKVFSGREKQADSRQGPDQQKEKKVYRLTDDKVKKASEALLRQKVEGGEQKTKPEAPGKDKTYYYEIELITGGTVFTDNLTVTDTAYTYRNRSGLIVSLRKDQVKTMKRLEVEK